MAAIPPPPQVKAPKPNVQPPNTRVRVAPVVKKAVPALGGGSYTSGYSSALPATQGLPSRPTTPHPGPKVAAKPKVRVVVHPNGQVVIHHTAPAAPVVTAPAPSAGPKRTPAAAKPPHTAHAAPAPQLTVEQQAQGLLDPVEKSITDAINARVNAEQGAITSYTKDLAQMMGSYGPSAKAAYGNAETGQAAIDAALGQTLQGGGQSGQADLAARLAQINADPGTVARLTGAAGADTSGATGAFDARGAASLSDLIGRSASAQDYGAKLPGVAGLYGLQATKTAQAKATTDTANAVAQLEQQFPGLVQTLKQNGSQQQQLRFEHGVALLQANGGVVTPEIKTLLGGALPVGATPKAKIDQTNAATKANNAAVKTKLRLAIAKEQRTAQAKGQHLGLSAKDWQNYNSLALSGARAAHQGTPDGTHPPISWQQFLTIGLGEKIPIAILIAQGKKVYSKAEIAKGLIPRRG